MLSSVVDTFTPSALGTILLCAEHSKGCDYATIYAALRRHLSTRSIDRHFCEVHGFKYQGNPTRYVHPLHSLL